MMAADAAQPCIVALGFAIEGNDGQAAQFAARS
jgi:hypothetical protein